MIFDSEVLRKLARLEVTSRKLLEGRRRGLRDVFRRGGSVEFADHRAYAHGDDVRYVDWNVFRRLGELVVKQYEAEEDVELLVFLDRSSSMVARPGGGDGGMSKFEYARLMAGALGYISLANLDAVRIMPFAGEIGRTRGVWRGKASARGFLDELEAIESSAGATDLPGAVAAGLPPGGGKGVALLISDLFIEERALDLALSRLRSRRWQPFILHIADADERAPALSGRMRLIDSETGAEREVTVNSRMLERYGAFLEHRAQRMQEVARRHHTGFARVTTAMPFERVVLDLLRRRGLVR